MQTPEKGFYYHYKHDPNGPINVYAYEVIGTAFHTEEEGVYLVIYRPLYENDFLGPADFCARPLKMFLENVEKAGGVPRFSRITDAKIISELQRIKKENGW
jgi:hypothetical protein